MKTIKSALWGFIFGISVLWLIATTFPEKWGYFSFRMLANQYSGTIAMGAMSLCMLLAIRPKWLEKPLHGLDKGYRLHKWLGITALVATLTHFWFTHGTKWMVGWGWIERPNRQRPPQQIIEGFSLEQWLGGFRKTAESVGEYAFYIAVVLLVMALVKRIPYHWFKKLHKWLAVTYLAFVFHTVVLFNFSYWTQPVGIVIAVLLLAGTIAAIITLTKKIGAKNKVAGTVQAVNPLPNNDSVELLFDAPNWQGHQAGQFVFVSHPHFSEPHPFTLASSGTPLRILVKNLGDDTACLAEKINVGDKVTLEGAYGCFDFNDNAESQVWIAAGIGITPFLARLEQLAQSPSSQKITLFYSYPNAGNRLLDELKTNSAKANIRLILWHSQEKGRLTADIIKAESGLNAQSSVWFCGNANFGEQLRKSLTCKAFHQELFEMR